MWLYYVEQEMDALGYEWYPVFHDVHDETILRVRYTGMPREDVIKQTQAALQRAVGRANEIMCPKGNEIPMKVSPASGTCLSHFKVEE
jgi:hypothetical protein